MVFCLILMSQYVTWESVRVLVIDNRKMIIPVFIVQGLGISAGKITPDMSVFEIDLQIDNQMIYGVPQIPCSMQDRIRNYCKIQGKGISFSAISSKYVRSRIKNDSFFAESKIWCIFAVLLSAEALAMAF